mmetsp:Transcript_120213/g.345548  ORF Transcript_120213/g.345548 Transcript_120213/m.345548 type:complete len:335 (+) Transcript_120213:215-1219(+)
MDCMLWRPRFCCFRIFSMTSWCSAKVSAISLSKDSSFSMNSHLLEPSAACRRCKRSWSRQLCATRCSKASKRATRAWATSEFTPFTTPSCKSTSLSTDSASLSNLFLHQATSQGIAFRDKGRMPTARKITARWKARRSMPPPCPARSWVKEAAMASMSRSVRRTLKSERVSLSAGRRPQTSSRLASPLATINLSNKEPHRSANNSRDNSFSSCASSRRSSFFSTILSLMRPLRRAKRPKLPKMMNEQRKHNKPGCAHSRPFCSWYRGKSGEATSSNKDNIATRTLPKFSSRNAACSSSGSGCPKVLTMTTEHTYKAKFMKRPTQKMARAASPKP